MLDIIFAIVIMIFWFFLHCCLKEQILSLSLFFGNKEKGLWLDVVTSHLSVIFYIFSPLYCAHWLFLGFFFPSENSLLLLESIFYI